MRRFCSDDVEGWARTFVALGTSLLIGAANAQTPPVVPSEASPGVLQDQLRRTAPGPSAPVTLPALPPALDTVPPTGAESIRLTVRDIQLSGNTVIPTVELEPAWRPLLGQEQPLTAIYA
ncbi:MAG: hypothetical protein EOO27_36530, partial [Comamonadaceae bacterium]